MNDNVKTNCGACRYWAPIMASGGFLGVCGHPQRPNNRCTDKVDLCMLFDEPESTCSKMKEFLE